MSRSGPRSPWAASWCTRAPGGGVGEIYDMGYAAGKAERWTESFSEGFRAGAVIGRRLAAGDDVLRCALRELLDDGGLDA